MGTTSEFGELILLIGDLHIPDRKPCIPKAFDELLNTDKISHILCTGNVGSPEVVNRLKSIAKDVHIVRGDMDVDFPGQPPYDFPEWRVIDVCGFRIGLVHGHQIIPRGSPEAMAAWRRKLDCDILVSGSTHQNFAERIDGKVYINPGSVTGAYSPALSASGTTCVPSFMLMSVQAGVVTLYVYELRDGKVRVAMSQFPKPETL